MDAIRIKSIGTIKDTGLLNICGVTLILGESAEGRNLLLRIICFMRWFEEKACQSTKEDSWTSLSGGELKEKMSKFGVPMEALEENSQILYDGEFIHLSWIQGRKVHLRIKGYRRGSAPVAGFLPSDRFTPPVSGLTELFSLHDDAKVMLEGRKDISMPNLPYASFYKTEDGFFYVHDEKEKDLIGTILPSASIALVAGGMLGRVGKSSGRVEREIVGCTRLGVEDVDADLSEGNAYGLVKLMYGMVHECNWKNRKQDKESSIVMSSVRSAEYDAMRRIVDEMDGRIGSGDMSCYYLCDDGMCVRMSLTT